jgi:serine O-acetyltransferase
MCAFFYFLYNSGYREKLNDKILTQLFYLNKILHSIDIFYTVELPDVVLFVHPLGTVIGKAKFDNYLVIYQNVTIGSTRESKELLYPKFGKSIIFYSNSSVIGDCKVGNNVTFGANANIVNKDIKDNKIVFGSFPKNRIINNNNIKKIYFK